MISVCNRFTYIKQSHPLPTLWNIKRLFVLGDFRQWLFFLDLLLRNKPLFFLLNLGKEFLCGTFFGALFHQLALNGVLQEGFFHILRETAVELFQLAPCLFIVVDIGQ